MKSYLNLESLAALVRNKRGERGVRDVAKEIGVSGSTVSRVERGTTPDMESFLRLCDWLEVPPGCLFEGSRNTEQKNKLNELIIQLLSGQSFEPAIAKALATLIQSAYQGSTD